MKNELELLKQFHTAFGHPVEAKPTFLSDDRLALRIALIQEELNEVEEAMMVNYHPDIIKELSDLLVVTFGTIIECGYQDVIEQAFAEVMKSNMSKLGADGKPIYREDGKILKGINYEEANIEEIFKEYEKKEKSKINVNDNIENSF
jgi:predicted HAD superfamily Cof-like phosphohydrolase